MEQQGRLAPAAAAQARNEPLRVAAEPKGRQAVAPFAGWFVEEVRRELEETLGGDIYDEKLRIHTTLDAEVQRAAQEELADQLKAVERGDLGRFAGPAYGEALAGDEEETPYLQGAVVVLDVGSGDVLAWVGGRDFRDSRFDRVRGAHRQAGSVVQAVRLRRRAQRGPHDEPDPHGRSAARASSTAAAPGSRRTSTARSRAA